ncbi:MAG: hypothetical protein QXW44_06675 [Pyrobaculum sp.]
MAYENYEEVQEQEQEIQTTFSKKIVKTPEDLVFYTDTDDRGYPIYLLPNGEISIKRKPQGLKIAGVIYVKTVEKVNEEVTHPLYQQAVDAIKDIMGEPPRWIYRSKIVYEIYRGDMEQLLGEATGYAIKLETPSKFSGDKFAAKKAFASAYDAKRRIAAKYKEFENRVYVKGEYGRRGRAYVNVVLKLPIASEELKQLFERLVTQIEVKKEEKEIEVKEETVVKKEEKKEVTAASVNIEEIERRIRQLEEELLVLKSKLELLKSRSAADGGASSSSELTNLSHDDHDDEDVCPRCGKTGRRYTLRRNGKPYIYYVHYNYKQRQFCYIGPAEKYDYVERFHNLALTNFKDANYYDTLAQVITLIVQKSKDKTEARRRVIETVLRTLEVEV